MQEYLQKTRLGAMADRWGGILLMLLGSVLFFLLLWGMRLTAIVAGAAAFAMLLILRRKTRQSRLMRREKLLRARIGGELKMEEWLLAPPRRAHFEAALLLSGVHANLTLNRAGEEGVLCAMDGETLLIACARRHAESELSADDVAAFQRACLKSKASRGALCAVGKTSSFAREQAALPPRITLIGRARMIALAGAACPATDAQLVALGRRKREKKPLRELLRAVLDRRRAPKYLLYGLLLLCMYILTGAKYYPIPGCLCVMLMAVCRLHAEKTDDELE